MLIPCVKGSKAKRPGVYVILVTAAIRGGPPIGCLILPLILELLQPGQVLVVVFPGWAIGSQLLGKAVHAFSAGWSSEPRKKEMAASEMAATGSG